jgi:hypothetical protein
VKSRAWCIAAGLACSVALGAVGLWGFWDVWLDLWWSGVAARPLTEAQARELQTCGKVGWPVLVKVLEQDLEAPCTSSWVEHALAGRGSERRMRWLDTIARSTSREPRERLRAGVGLLLAGEPAVPGLALLASEPDLPAVERQNLVALLASGELPSEWADPTLRAEAAVRRLADGDLGAAPDVMRHLRRVALEPHPGEERQREALAEIALEAVGLGGGRLAAAVARREQGLPLRDMPASLVRPVVNRGHVCRDLGTPSCLRLAADLLEYQYHSALEGGDGGPEVLAPLDAEAYAVVDLPTALWEVAYEDPAAAQAAAELFGDMALWIAGAAPDERSGRLLGVVAHGHHAYGAPLARAGLVGDPIHVLRNRRGTPWSTALAAVALSERVGLPITVEAVGDGVILRLPGRIAGIGPCGAPLLPPEVPGEAWPARAVLAQAVVESAGAALRRKDAYDAHRLAVLAERVDPVGAAGVTAVIDHVLPQPQDPDGAAGRSLGSLLVDGDAAAPTGAETSRRQRAQTWDHALVEWNQTPTGGMCPGVLGP